MHAFLSALRRIPYWAYLSVLLVITVNAIHLVYLYKAPRSGEHFSLINGYYIIDYIGENTPVSRTEIKPGDTLVSVNGISIAEFTSFYHGQIAGDTLISGILRNNLEVGIPVIEDSWLSEGGGYIWSSFIFVILVSIGSLFLIVVRSYSKEVRLFFIYIQLLSIVTFHTKFTMFPMFLPVLSKTVFIFAGALYGPVLIHFYLIFPRHALILQRFRKLPLVFYGAGVVIAIFFLIRYLEGVFIPSVETVELFNKAVSVSLYSTTAFFMIALGIAIYQFITIKITLARNQLLPLLAGSFFVFLPLFMFTFFFDWVIGIPWAYTLEAAFATGNLILVICILIAIFRYRIWDIEVFIRKALLYLSATAVIILCYLFLIWFVDRFISRETNITRFVILAVSVILFLILRDRIQRMIDRLFHREEYDSATVVSGFEAKLSGIYRFDELKEKIFKGLDDIFHFSFFTFHLKKGNLIYEPVFVYGATQPAAGNEYEISRELEERLQKSKVFSPEELNTKPPFLEETTGELVVPLISDGQPNGFFICGQKKSERIYSRQDIQVLRLLAQRVVSLLHTAGLYQKDLDRQLMLERERARISQDMHDDVGASLTRISILSELAKNRAETDRETKQWLEQITTTSRGVMEEMSQIIWALNPKNDTLEGLMAYIRRFANEYLEPTSIHCTFVLPEILPNIPLSVEVRRNIYLVVREALHNVVKHSGAKYVGISLFMNENGFNIIIKDDGKGFDPANLEFPGNGLVNIKKRMADIGGGSIIISSPGEGTEITLLVSPLRG
jgi:signal transduction histidine kinase